MNIPAFIIYVITTTFTPGPNNLMAMSHGLHTGFKRTSPFLFGVFCGFLIVMLICGSVNFVLMSLLPTIQHWLNIFGAGYMLYLAFHIMASDMHDANSNISLNTFKAGLTMQFINPKVILYGITIFSSFIIPSYQDPFTLLIFSIFLAIVGLASTTSWAAFGVGFNAFFVNYRKFINFSMGALLIYSAIVSLQH